MFVTVKCESHALLLCWTQTLCEKVGTPRVRAAPFLRSDKINASHNARREMGRSLNLLPVTLRD